MRIRLSDDAQAFIYSEARYLRARSSPAARHFLDRIKEAKRNLSLFPHMGSETEGSPMRGERRIVIGDYILIYDIVDDMIAISSIRHGRMMPPASVIDENRSYEASDDVS